MIEIVDWGSWLYGFLFGAGMIFVMFLLFMYFMPWLCGWRRADYNVNWRDEIIVYNMEREIKWKHPELGSLRIRTLGTPTSSVTAPDPLDQWRKWMK